MDRIKFIDEYEIKARYIPTFLSIAPLIHFLVLFLGTQFWNELIDNISYMLIANLTLSFIIMLAFVQFQCFFSKYFIEEKIFGKGGKKFPTTNMLLYTYRLISIDRKKQLHNKIKEIFDCKLSTEEEENINLKDAILQAREAVGHVRSFVGKGRITFQYNIRYGFFRNFIGGIIWSGIGSIGCSIIYGIKNEWKFMSFFIFIFLTHFIIFSIKKKLLKDLAFSYADTLYNEFLTKINKEKA